MLKVGRKRKRKETKKEGQKAHKFDCQDACSRFSASWLIASRAWNFTTQPKNEIWDTFDNIMSWTITRPTVWKKKTLLTPFQMKLRFKKSEVNRANIFCGKKLKQKRVWPSKSSFLQWPTLSWCSIGAASSPNSKHKANRPWDIKESFLAFWLSS